MTRRLAIIGSFAFAALLTAWGLQDGPAAIIVRLDGQVQVQQGGGAPQPATVGMRLSVGDRLSPATGASAVILRKTGEKLTVTAATVIEAAGAPPEQGSFSRALKTLADVSTTAARNQPNRQGMIRPIPGTPVPVAPRNNLPVLDARPSFTWLSVAGATGYRVQIQRVGGQPLRYEAGADTAWTLPPGTPPLIPGETYRWTVGAEPSRRVAEPETFRVIGPAAYTSLSQTLVELAKAGFEPAGDGLLLAALAYRDAGLYYEAERALEGLAASGTPLGREFYYLQGEVYDALGKLDAARAAFDKADAMSP